MPAQRWQVAAWTGATTPVPDLDADDRQREQRSAIAFAVGHIQQLAIGEPRAGQQIAVIMLDPDLASDGSGAALAGERLRMFRSLAANDLAHDYAV
jgi:hypothetical protein